MKEHSDYGISAREDGWVPSPQYLLRRQRILRFFDGSPPLNILEIGCGSGALLHDLTSMGHRCTAIEISEDALSLAKKVNYGNPHVEILSEPRETFNGEFDVVIACEVLEHIEDDIATYTAWSRYLRPGGRLIISVPAHPSKWDATDEWAGHYRRYTRERFRTLAENANLETERVECYAFPFTNIVAPLRAFLLRRETRRSVRAGSDDMDKRTKKSGTARKLQSRLYPLQTSPVGVLAMRMLFRMQDRFIRKDWGLCYIFSARQTADYD